MTNFDLSTYIRWLKPETNNMIPGRGSHSLLEPTQLSLPSPTEYSPREDYKYSLFPSYSYTAENLQCSPLRPKQDQLIGSNFGSVSRPSPSSSPTALGLLFRSSVFRELMEKNASSNNSDDEDQIGGDHGEVSKQYQNGVGSDDEFGGLFCDTICDINVPFVYFDGDQQQHNVELQQQEPFIL